MIEPSMQSAWARKRGTRWRRGGRSGRRLRRFEQLLDDVQRFRDVGLLEETKVPDAEYLAVELALAAAKDHTEFLAGTLADRLAVHALGPVDGRHGVGGEPL